MSSQGKFFACPLGNWIQSTSCKVRSATAERLARFQAAEDDFCSQECNHIASRLLNTETLTTPVQERVETEPQDQTSNTDPHNEYEYGLDCTDQEANAWNNEESPDGRRYASRRVEEEELWQLVIGSMFVTYMWCKSLNQSWGHSEKWNHDWHIDCLCPPSVIRKQNVDCVDITCKPERVSL